MDRAGAAFIRSDPARASEIVDALREARPDSPGIAIADALLTVGRGDRAEARDRLGALLAEEPGLRAPLELDPDLGPLLEDE